MHLGGFLGGECYVPRDDRVSGMICKSALYDVCRIVMPLSTIDSKMQSSEQSDLKCQEERIFSVAYRWQADITDE